MPAMLTRVYGVLLCLPLVGAATLASTRSHAADIYDAAVQHSGRSAEDLKRDEAEHPAAVLRSAGIKPGMQGQDGPLRAGVSQE
jgi:predicted methyltransferase